VDDSGGTHLGNGKGRGGFVVIKRTTLNDASAAHDQDFQRERMRVAPNEDAVQTLTSGPQRHKLSHGRRGAGLVAIRPIHCGVSLVADKCRIGPIAYRVFT
jgi:hypothetical protein